MAVFDEQIARLKRDEQIFQKCLMNEKTGIILSEKKQMDLEKKGGDLLEIDAQIRIRKYRSTECYYIINKTLKEYSLLEWEMCIKRRVLLEYALPILSRALVLYPMLDEWEVLYSIARLPETFWNKHKSWKQFYVGIVKDILYNNIEKDCMAFSEEYFDQFEIFVLSDL